MKQQPFWFQGMSPLEAIRWKKPIVSLLIVGLCGLLFFVQWAFPQQPLYNPFFFEIPYSIFDLHKLLTPIFLHFSVLHLAFNISIFWFFARQVETLLGRKALLTLVIIAGVVSNVGQYFAQGPQFGGLSGVVMAMIGFVWMASKVAPERRFFMPNGLIVLVGISLILGFLGILDLLLGPIAHVAHTLGFISGLFLWPVISRFCPEDA